MTMIYCQFSSTIGLNCAVARQTIFLTDDSSDHKILFFCKVLKMDTENNQIVFCCSLARPTVAFCKTNLLAQRDWFFQLVETAA